MVHVLLERSASWVTKNDASLLSNAANGRVVTIYLPPASCVKFKHCKKLCHILMHGNT